jgi:hypothetical protein
MKQDGAGRSIGLGGDNGMKDIFSSAELVTLRNDLIHDGLIDSR